MAWIKAILLLAIVLVMLILLFVTDQPMDVKNVPVAVVLRIPAECTRYAQRFERFGAFDASGGANSMSDARSCRLVIRLNRL